MWRGRKLMVRAWPLVHLAFSGQGPHWRLPNRTTVYGAIAGVSFQLPLTLPFGQVTSRRSMMKFCLANPSLALACWELFLPIGPTSAIL